jgi:hypothetical protein
MNILVKSILHRVIDSVGTNADMARLPAAYRRSGGGLMSRIATAGILRLAFRWPALTVLVILSAIAARVLTGRRRPADDVRPALRAP